MHRHVVAGIDGSPESLAAAHWAAREALRRGPDGASLDSDRDSVKTPYRNVVLGLGTSSPCDELIEFAFDAAQHRGATLRVIQTFSAPPPYAVTRASTGAGVVVVGRRIRSGHLGIHIGPVAHAVLHHVGWPSLSLRTADPPPAGGRDS